MRMIARGAELLFRAVFGFSFLFCLGLGLFFLNLQLRAMGAARRSKTWPSVTWQIVCSEIQRVVTNEEGSEVVSYRPHVEFSYPVAGVAYRSNHIRHGGGTYLSGLKWLANSYVRRYQAGMPVQVSYDPIKPSDAVLEAGRVGWEHGVMSLICLLGAAVVWKFVLNR